MKLLEKDAVFKAKQMELKKYLSEQKISLNCHVRIATEIALV